MTLATPRKRVWWYSRLRLLRRFEKWQSSDMVFDAHNANVVVSRGDRLEPSLNMYCFFSSLSYFFYSICGTDTSRDRKQLQTAIYVHIVPKNQPQTSDKIARIGNTIVDILDTNQYSSQTTTAWPKHRLLGHPILMTDSDTYCSTCLLAVSEPYGHHSRQFLRCQTQIYDQLP